jgi:hypothetical protein
MPGSCLRLGKAQDSESADGALANDRRVSLGAPHWQDGQHMLDRPRVWVDQPALIDDAS